MQLQQLQNKPNNSPFVQSTEVYFVPIPRNFERVPGNVSVSIGSNAQSVETTESLIALARKQTLSLVETLTKLKARNESVIYPIMAPLVHFMQATEELSFDMPPTSTRKGIGRVVHRGIAEPDFSFE